MYMIAVLVQISVEPIYRHLTLIPGYKYVFMAVLSVLTIL